MTGAPDREAPGASPGDAQSTPARAGAAEPGAPEASAAEGRSTPGRAGGAPVAPGPSGGGAEDQHRAGGAPVAPDQSGRVGEEDRHRPGGGPVPGAGDPERGYRIAAVVVKPLMRAWFRIRLEGEHHIPPAGPAILASNHRSNMDPVLLASAVTRPVAFMAKAELFVWPLGPILRWIGQFPVRRGGIDREALRRTDAILARGSVLGLFPEGTRGDGSFSAVHPGLAYIVVRQRCPVLPVAIFGTERVRRRYGWLPFASPVRIVVGPPIDLPGSTSDRAGRRAASERLQQGLQAFLATADPPQITHKDTNQ